MKAASRVVALFAMVFTMCGCAGAAEIETGKVVLLPKAETANDDVIAAGTHVSIESRVKGDVAATGWTVAVSGPVKDSVMLAGYQVAVLGNVGNDAWVAGTLVELNSSVADNAYLCGSTINVAKSASVGKDLMAAGGNLGVAGKIGRNLRAAGKDVTIAGTVGGDVLASAERLRIVRGALIKGNLFYESSNNALIDPRAKILGTVKHRLPKAEKARPVFWPRFAGWFGQLVAAILFGTVLLILFPARARETAEGVRRSFWSSLGVGLLVLIAAPVAFVILAVTIVGIPLAVAGLLVYAVLLYAAWIFTALGLGQGVLARAGVAAPKAVGSMILGLALLALAHLIPYVGCLIALGAVAAGLGAFLPRWWRRTRPAESDPGPAEAA